MNESIKYLLDHTPVWLMIILICMTGIIMFGPKYIMEWVKVRREMTKREDDPTLQSEYLLLLKKNNQNLEDQLDLKNKELKELTKLVDKLRK